MIDFYHNIPLYIDPIAFTVGSFTIRWYGLTYLFGFLVVYRLLRIRISRGEFPVTIFNFLRQLADPISNKKEISNLVMDFLVVVFFAGLVGGRLGYVLFYNPAFYFANPLAIISPYDFQGNYVGLFGMSYHGALLGAILAGYIFARIKKLDFLAWADFIIVAVPLGYFFGRIGNFLNGELYGRVTNSPLGMYFTADPTHLRHPSQLYEAFLEGILLFIILWKMRSADWRKKNKKGQLLGIYLVGYGLLRIVVEQFRQPDSQLGLFWNYFTMGQLLSAAMIFVGLFFLMIPKNEK